MKEFIGKGSMTLEKVIFYVRAKDLKEAQDKLMRGEYDSYDIDAAEAINAHVAGSSVEENS